MSEIKYDSLYSALKALNVALGGDEINDADSTYTVIERLSETLGLSEQTPMLLSTREGSECPTTSIEIGANGEYNIDENTGFVGWNQVNVNIPNFEIPETELVSYTGTVNFGDPFEFIFKCKMPNGLETVELYIDGSMYAGDFDVSIIETNGKWVTAKYTSSKRVTESGYVNINGIVCHYNNGVDADIPVSYNMNFTCNGESVDLPESEWVEGTWGDPNQAIVCENIADFLTKPDSTKENPQWYEFNCRVLTAPFVEDLRMVVDDDSISETAANNPLLNNRGGKIGIVINQSNNILASCGPMCMNSNNWNDIFPGDEKWCKIRTLKFTADQNYIITSGDIIVKQGTVFGGKFNDSPCAIIVEKYETKP